MPDKKPTATPKRAATAKPAAKPSAKPAPKAKASSAPKAAATPKPEATSSSEGFRAQANNFRGKASDKAREYADTGKDKATTLLDNLSKTVEELARSVDERLGSNYGDYTRKAASAVSDAAEKLKAKDVDDIVSDTRDFVRSRPAVAIGAAAAVGFLIARLVKAGSGDRDDA